MCQSEPGYIGIDVGGTKLLALALDHAGALVGRCKRTTRHDGTPLVEQVAALLEALVAEAGLAWEEIAGVGVAVPGVVDGETGRVLNAPNLEGFEPDLGDLLRARFPVPFAIGNDVNLGTLAEVYHGAARGASCVVGVFPGTGLGGALVMEGEVRVGPQGLGGEIGHMILQVDGPLCGCGNRGCFEALASRTALERDLREALEQGRPSRILEFARNGRITSGSLAAAVAAGDDLVTELLTRLGHYLGQGVLSLRHVLDPDIVVLGGGVMEACGPFLLPLIEKEVADSKFQGARLTMRIVLSALGDDAVALGAADLARAQVEGPTLRSYDPGLARRPAPVYPIIDGVDFGSVIVGGKKIASDLSIRADGKVRERKKGPTREQYGTSHLVGLAELGRLCQGGPHTLIIGSGFQGRLGLAPEGEAFLREAGVEYELLPTPQAAARYGEIDGPKALLLHVTC